MLVGAPRLGCVGQGRVPRVGWEMGQAVPLWGRSALPQPQAQAGDAAGRTGGRSPYLSLPRGGFGGVEHLLPPLHPRHGLHVLAPVAHFHGALLPGGTGTGLSGGTAGSPTPSHPTARSPARGQQLPCCKPPCPVGLGLARSSGCAWVPAQNLAKLHWEARKSQKIFSGGRSQHVGLTPELHQMRAEPFSAPIFCAGGSQLRFLPALGWDWGCW